MNSRVVITPDCERMVKRLFRKHRSIKQDLSKLIDELVIDPSVGTLVQSNVRKIRLAISSKGKGKSGGARVLTFLYMTTPPVDQAATVYIFAVYDKSKKNSLTDGEINELLIKADLK